jgi:hypothetical protein
VSIGILPAWATVVALGGGGAWHTAHWSIASHDPIRPLFGAAIAALVYWRRFWGEHGVEDAEWLRARVARLSLPGVFVVCAAAFFVAVRYGTFSASGSDPYGYVSQADLWLRGSLRVQQPWTRELPWPSVDWTFTPLGYRPATVPGAIVPSYASGLPLIMAGFSVLFGASGPFYVVPVCGALAVWLTFALGRDASGSSSAGTTAALLLATSPAFLFQLMWPMSDVPATALWALSFWLGLRFRGRRPLASGIAASVAILIRPNLAPLALTLPAGWLWIARREKEGRPGAWPEVGWFTLGLIPGVAAAAAVNLYLYGSAFSSGYGDLAGLYSTVNLSTNARRYAAWMVETQTPLIALGIVSLVLPSAPGEEGRSQRACRYILAGCIGVVILSYLFYAPFDDWWYLRFLLPAFPPLFVLLACALCWAGRRLPAGLRVPVAAVVLCGLCAHGLTFARDHEVFGLKAADRRYEAAARQVAERTPANAVVLSMQHSGSIRYYAGRLTLRYDLLAPEWLDRAVAILRANGQHAYVVLDEWEEPAFRERFGPVSPAGRLDWQPVVEIAGPVRVKAFDLDGHEPDLLRRRAPGR